MDGRPAEPSLSRGIIEEVGQGFLVGGACSSAFHAVKGIRNPTAGVGRLASAAWAVRSKAPRGAGSMAAFFGLYYGFKKTMVLARRKEDRWNSAAATAATMGVLSMRRGASVTVGVALLGGALSLLLDGATDALANHVVSVTQPAPPPAAVSRRPGPDDAPVVAGHPEGFLGIPPGQPIVVEELPASDHRFY